MGMLPSVACGKLVRALPIVMPLRCHPAKMPKARAPSWLATGRHGKAAWSAVPNGAGRGEPRDEGRCARAGGRGRGGGGGAASCLRRRTCQAGVGHEAAAAADRGSMAHPPLGGP